MNSIDRPLVWLESRIRTPPFSRSARLEAGLLLRRLQRGELPGMPHSRQMTSIGPRCHELRINDETVTWRIVYRIDRDAIIIVDVFRKKTVAMSARKIQTCRRRLREYDNA